MPAKDTPRPGDIYFFRRRYMYLLLLMSTNLRIRREDIFLWRSLSERNIETSVIFMHMPIFERGGAASQLFDSCYQRALTAVLVSTDNTHRRDSLAAASRLRCMGWIYGYNGVRSSEKWSCKADSRKALMVGTAEYWFNTLRDYRNNPGVIEKIVGVWAGAVD